MDRPTNVCFFTRAFEGLDHILGSTCKEFYDTFGFIAPRGVISGAFLTELTGLTWVEALDISDSTCTSGSDITVNKSISKWPVFSVFETGVAREDRIKDAVIGQDVPVPVQYIGYFSLL